MANSVDPDQTGSILFAHTYLSRYLGSKILFFFFFQNGRSLDQQAEELLNLLPTRGRDTFQKFCDALREDMQDEIVDLYLVPESSDVKEDDKNSIQETVSNAGSEESQDSVAAGSGADMKCSKNEADDRQVSVSRSAAEVAEVSKTVSPVGLSICEEFQQQTYRRSFEPSLVRTSQDNVDSGQSAYQTCIEPHALNRSVGGLQQSELDHQARIFYQNSILHPENASSAVFSVTNGQRIIGSGLPYNKLEKDSVPKCYSPVNPLLQRGSSPIRPDASLPTKYESPVKDNVASQYIPSYRIPTSPSLVHHLSPYKDSIEQLQHSPHKIQPPSSPLVFKNIQGDLNGARLIERFDKPPGDRDYGMERGQIRGNESRHQSGILFQSETQRKNYIKNSGDNSCTNIAFQRSNSDQENDTFTLRQSHPSNAAIQDFQPKYVNEREFMELQGHRERQLSNSDDREMFTLPRHIERMCPERVTEEILNRGENLIPRLARLDSVGKCAQIMSNLHNYQPGTGARWDARLPGILMVTGSILTSGNRIS